MVYLKDIREVNVNLDEDEVFKPQQVIPVITEFDGNYDVNYCKTINSNFDTKLLPENSLIETPVRI